MSNQKEALVQCGKQFYERRWMWGTAGNLSVRLKNQPLEIAVTPSGLNKGQLRVADLLTVTDGKLPKHPKRYVPSAETVIHQAVYRAIPEAQATFHVHPIYSTVLSSHYGDDQAIRSLSVEWFEMMKGVGVPEGETAEIPIFPNWQDVSRVAGDFSGYVQNQRAQKKAVLPVILIYKHGLTAWGKTVDQARNHLEIVEYVCQYLYLKRLMGHLTASG